MQYLTQHHQALEMRITTDEPSHSKRIQKERVL